LQLVEIAAFDRLTRLQHFTGAGADRDSDLLRSDLHLRVDCRRLIGLDHDSTNRRSLETGGFQDYVIGPQIDCVKAINSGVVCSCCSNFVGG
jgi:hypothetical protein